MRIAIFAALPLAGCAFNLGYVQPQTGRTQDQLQLDLLVCKDQAARSVETGGRIAGDAALGATVIGLPLAVHLDRAKERQVFKDCMNAKGYTVVRNY